MICIKCIHLQKGKCTITNHLKGMFNECDCKSFKEKVEIK
jgi:hypothetical protein